MSMMKSLGQQVSDLLDPIAQIFRDLDIPAPITHWGHPVMMGIVIFAMGSYVGWTGWRGRVLAAQTDTGSESAETVNKLFGNHRKAAPFMSMFLALGYTGGLLSLVMQNEPILESPHFWTGTLVLGLLGLNGTLSITKFGGGKAALRSLHAYLGAVVLLVMVVHAGLGLALGLSF